MSLAARVKTQSANINVMAMAVQKAARGIIRDFGELEHLQVSRKSLGDFVSAADHRSERVLIQELSKARPDFGFICEESGKYESNDSEFTWVIDPLDGTTNFLHGVPHFAITVGLMQGEEVIAGVTYDPIKDELFWAEKGRGAFMNNRRLRVSGRRYLDECIVATGIPFGGHGNRDLFLKQLDKVIPQVAGVRRFGAAALDLAYVAAGRFDAYFESDCSIWDLAAGVLLVLEAGGFVSSLTANKNYLHSGSLLAANTQIHGALHSTLNIA